MVDFTATDNQLDMIEKIVERARGHYGQIDTMEMTMDLVACISNGCPLDLEGLYKADDFNFIHDICGITWYMDRDTGKLMNCFVPRFASKE